MSEGQHICYNSVYSRGKKLIPRPIEANDGAGTKRHMAEQVGIKNLLLLLSLLSLLAPVTAALSETNLTTTTTITTTTSTTPTTTFTDDTGFTVNLPPEWTVVDVNNTNQEVREGPAIAGSDYNLLELCPPGKSVVSEHDPFFKKAGCSGYFDSIQVQRLLNLDKEKSFVPYAGSGVDPNTGLTILNITADDIIEYTKNPMDILVQAKNVPVNVTDVSNGTHWQVQGKLALFSTYDDKLKYIGLYFAVDSYNNTMGYRVTYSAPIGAEADPSLIWDPRGDPIPIYGIGLDNLPPAFEPIMQILKSVSIQLGHRNDDTGG